jgi:A/G-specific adenine glycosylase
MSPIQFQQCLLSWFDVHGRHDLPWQRDITPYTVWVSEIMLQQTQVASVVGYFQRFMQRFPDINVLAQADVDSVLQHWAGLGYYARARNLHKTAQLLAAAGGEFPQSVAELTALPGIGRSTAGAILSIACGQSKAILDGNVKRVLARMHAVHGWPGNAAVAARLWELAQRYTPEQRAGHYAQAMMDLGATLCTRSKPACSACPVAEGCQALQQGLVQRLPESKPKQTLAIKQRYWLLLADRQQQYLLQRRPPSGIWGGLWTLPEFDDLTQMRQWCAQQGWDIESQSIGQTLQHRFSHFLLEYTPVTAGLHRSADAVMSDDALVWHSAVQIKQLALPTPLRHLLQSTLFYNED